VSPGYEAVIVAGGEGTVNEVVNGLMGSDVTLDISPWGTGNIPAMETDLFQRGAKG